MLKRAELLEELKRLSETAFKSEDFVKIPEFESSLVKAEQELSEALHEAIKYNLPLLTHTDTIVMWTGEYGIGHSEFGEKKIF